MLDKSNNQVQAASKESLPELPKLNLERSRDPLSELQLPKSAPLQRQALGLSSEQLGLSTAREALKYGDKYLQGLPASPEAYAGSSYQDLADETLIRVHKGVKQIASNFKEQGGKWLKTAEAIEGTPESSLLKNYGERRIAQAYEIERRASLLRGSPESAVASLNERGLKFA